MDKDNSPNQQQPVCGNEALDLLNCVAQSNYDHERCISLLQALRECVLNKKVKKFSLAEQSKEQPDAASGKKKT